MSAHTLNGTALHNALCTVPASDWARVWCPESTVALRMTSKAIRKQTDKMRLPIAVHSNWHNMFEGRNALSARDHHNQAFSQLRVLSSVCVLTTIALVDCDLQQVFLRVVGQPTDCRGLALQPLADVLWQCPDLEDLDLGWNGISSAGLERFADPLAACTRLTKLAMHGNLIGNLGAARLAGVLAQLPALAYLDVSRNNITGLGFAKIAQALPNCPAIAVLRLEHNKIGDNLEELAAAMPLCMALRHIDVSHTDLGMFGLLLMFSARPFLRHIEIVKEGNPDIEHLREFEFDNSNPLFSWIPALVY